MKWVCPKNGPMSPLSDGRGAAGKFGEDPGIGCLSRLGLEKDRYILLSAHREENIDTEKNFTSLFTAINCTGTEV